MIYLIHSKSYLILNRTFKIKTVVEFYQDGYGSFGGLVFENVPVSEADVIIVGIPYESATSGKKGASFGPVELRKVSVDMQTISRDGTDLNNLILKDMGNVEVFSIQGEKTRESIEKSYDYLFSEVNGPILTLGGDHSNTYPVLKSLAKKGTVGIIWFDAHRDVLSELLGSRWSHGSPLRRALELDTINPENVLLIGTRYMDASEQEYVEDMGIDELRMVDLERSDFDMKEFNQKVEAMRENVDYLYISIDIDVLDPAFAPATGTPVGGGMTTSQLMQYISSIPVKVDAWDIMEIAPPHDHAEITVKATMGLISEILGQKVRNEAE